MKKLDKLLTVSFIPPFILTFFIALFVLIMQFLWLYIDDIIGKGLDTSVILELLFYRSTAFVPLALPIAVLISSVMVMGDLAERYELASMKSAGIPLIRIMVPMIVLVGFVCVGSFISSDTLIPYSNLKFKSRLFDIRKQKPALSFEEGVFNDDFGETIIRIDKKSENGRDLTNVLIYDHSENRGNVNQIIAKRGEMYMSSSKKYMVMKLHDGNQYQELVPKELKEGKRYQHLRTSFKEWEKVFDLSTFDLSETGEDSFKDHYSMLSTRQLSKGIDSLYQRKENRRLMLNKQVKYFYYPRRAHDSTKIKLARKTKELRLENYSSSFLYEVDAPKQAMALRKAASLTRNVKNYAQSLQKELPRIDETIAKFELEYNRKFSLAMACMIFLFIGAPMGAIVRKGGFGWPILIAIVFFVFFITMNSMGEKLAKEMVVSPEFGMWMPCFVLAPIGVFLTVMAMRDSEILTFDAYVDFFKRLYNRILRLKNDE